MDNLIGNRLKKLRIESGFSMEEEALKLNQSFNLKITKSMMSRWETGAAQPTNIFLSAYAQYHNVDLNYLVGLTDIKRPLHNTKDMDFSCEEKDLIQKYRSLDDRGKRAVQDTIYREMGYVIKEPLFRAAEK